MAFIFDGEDAEVPPPSETAERTASTSVSVKTTKIFAEKVDSSH
jgi:hypothetical protein